MPKSSRARNSKRKTNMRRRKQQRKRGATRPVNANQALVYNKQSTKPMRFVKTVRAGSVFNGLNTAISAVNAYQAQYMPDIGNIQLLFNRYKINKITLTYRLKDTGNGDALNFNTVMMPTMWIRYNYDSNDFTTATPTATVGSKILELNNVKSFTFTPEKTQFQYVVHPRTISPVYLSSILTGYKLNPKQYIDVAYTNVPHYGIVWYIDQLPTGLQLEVDTTFDVSFQYSE